METRIRNENYFSKIVINKIKIVVQRLLNKLKILGGIFGKIIRRNLKDLGFNRNERRNEKV